MLSKISHGQGRNVIIPDMLVFPQCYFARQQGSCVLAKQYNILNQF